MPFKFPPKIRHAWFCKCPGVFLQQIYVKTAHFPPAILCLCNTTVGIPVMRNGRAAYPCALNFCLAALKCPFERPSNALSSVRVWPSMPPLCASFIQNVITLTGSFIYRKKNVAYLNTVTCLLISNCSGKQTINPINNYDTSNPVYFRRHMWNYMYAIQVQSALFKIKQLSENVLRWPKATHMPIFSELIIQLFRLK